VSFHYSFYPNNLPQFPVFIDFILYHFYFRLLLATNISTQRKQCLVLQLDNHLNWKDHIDQLIPKLSAACYTVRLMFHISNIITLKSVYFAYFQFTMQYGMLRWGEILPTLGEYLLYKRK